MLAIAGLTGGVLYNLVETGELASFGIASYWSSGLRYPGGILAVILVLPLVAALLPQHLSMPGCLDLMAPATAFAMATVRLGCFLAGCCYGLPSDLPWAVRYPPLSQVARHHVMNDWIAPGAWSLPVHPLQAYFALASLSVGIFLLWFQRRKAYDGQVFLLYLVLHDGSKGVLEFLRGSIPTHSVVHLRVVALGLATAGAALLLARARGYLTRVLPPLSTAPA
jgi:phosphatidylglycerol:prolipoprotein diacylglycerol transferase